MVNFFVIILPSSLHKKYLYLLLILTILNRMTINGEISPPRNKEIDENYQKLIKFSEIPKDCFSSQIGYGIVEGGLEKCEIYLKEDRQLEPNHEDGTYERFKCKHLRVHAKVNESGLCECEHNWKGPICNEFVGCPEDHSLYNGVCTPNICQHDGQLAIGTKHIECICKAPWDGRWCERLACWRMAQKEHEKRWRNSGDHCRCADGFEGSNCDHIRYCKNGELVSGRCVCSEGFKGEICERKCIPNQTCSGSKSATIALFINLLLLLLPTFLLTKLS